ncbi:MAG: HAD-IA family hydrolase [Woeseiaceae bacterium]|nr:HAD-IA family hydrolase [Woeseiaceae bacterium]
MTSPEGRLPAQVETLMLDMDGTVLDLAYDNELWLRRVPEAYAATHGLHPDEARQRLYGWFREFRGTLEWYCLDHWSDRLQFDVVALHREHRAQIRYLPGARESLEALSARSMRLLLVTNSHRSTLDLKHAMTGIGGYFDEIYTSHDLGHPKEDRKFWEALRALEGFDARTSLFVDDSVPVLRSASSYGIRHLRQIMQPDTGRPACEPKDFTGVVSLLELVPGREPAAGARAAV